MFVLGIIWIITALDNDVMVLSEWQEKRLISHILKDYDKESRPVFDNYSVMVGGDNDIQQITIEFGLSLIQIVDLNEMEQVLTTSVRSLYRWKDLDLVWDRKNYQNISTVYIPTELIWIPDISLYNYADERLEERRPSSARVYWDGTVEWQPQAIYKSTCSVNMKYFPFDNQTCWWKFGPWTYDGYRVNITFYNDEASLDLKGLTPSPEWRIKESYAKHTENRYPCCDEPYPDISFYIVMIRNPTFYAYILIFPCFLLSSLTLVSFWLPPESPAKIVLGMNIFVAFFLLLLLLQDYTPSTSKNEDFSNLAIYFCFNMTLITLSTFLSCIIVNFHFRGDNRQEVPYWVKKLAFDYAAKLLRIEFGSTLIKKKSQSSSYAFEVTKEREERFQKLKSQIFQAPSAKAVIAQQKPLPPNQNTLPSTAQNNWINFNTSTTPLSKTNSHLTITTSANNNNPIDFNSMAAWTTTHQQESNTKQSTIPSLGISVTLSPSSQKHATAAIFPPEFTSTDLYKQLESCSPLHSPILQDKFHFIDDQQQQHPPQQQRRTANHENRDSSTFPLLQDAVAHSISKLSQYQNDASPCLYPPELFPTTPTPTHESILPSIAARAVALTSLNQSINSIAAKQWDSEQMKRICLDVRTIVKSLKYIQKLQDNKENVARIYSEWRCIGTVLDRIFFYSYLLIICSTLIMYFPNSYNSFSTL